VLPAQAQRPRLGRVRIAALTVILVIGTVGVVVGAQHLAVTAVSAAPAAPAVPAVGPPPVPKDVDVAQPSPFPPPPADAQSTRVLPAVPVTGHGPHSWLTTLPDGQPVAFDPCRPIHWVVNPARMPAGGLRMLRDAFAVVSAATGLAFHEDGETAEPYSANRPLRSPAYYGSGWAPVLVTWADARQVPDLAGDVVGIGGNSEMRPNGPASARVITGDVVLDTEFFTAALPSATGRRQARAAVLHELGHVVGLGHVDDPHQLMYSRETSMLNYGAGDREGLAILGAGSCHTDT
jgi:hypothetical protein